MTPLTDATSKQIRKWREARPVVPANRRPAQRLR